MSSFLSKIKKGTVDLPSRVVFAGPEGIGKSTFGANAPAPLFIAAEDGLTGLEHVDRFTPDTFKELLDILNEILAAASVEFKTLVIDTTDWLERLIHKFVCDRDDKKNIEEYGYGKGFTTIATVELNAMLVILDGIRAKHKVGILLLSHVKIETFTPPGADPFNRYEMKGNKHFTGILREWPDACLFATYETFTTKRDETKKLSEQNKKTIGGERIIHTQWAPGWDAKNRYNLPDPIPLDRERGFTALLELIEKHRSKPVPEPSADELRDRIRTLAPLAKFSDEDSKARFFDWLKTLDSASVDQLKAGVNKLEKLAN